MPLDYTDILKTCGPNSAGTGTEILFANKKDFTAIATPTSFATATTTDEIVTIDGNHTFAVGKGFRKLQITDRTGKVDSNFVGDIDAKSAEHMFSGFIPNNTPANLGVLSILATCEWIFLIPEESAEGTVYRQIGSVQHAAYTEEDNYTSDVTGGKRGTTYSIKSVGHSIHAPFYTGTVTLHP